MHSLSLKKLSKNVLHDIITSFNHEAIYSSGKEFTCNAEDARDVGLIPELGRFPWRRMATHSSILAWRIPWADEPGQPQSIGSQRVRDD